VQGWKVAIALVLFGGVAYALRRRGLAADDAAAALNPGAGGTVTTPSAGLAAELAPQVQATIDSARGSLTASGVVDVPGLAQVRAGSASSVVVDIDAATVERIGAALLAHHGWSPQAATIRAGMLDVMERAASTAHLHAVTNAGFRLRLAQWITHPSTNAGGYLASIARHDWIAVALGGSLEDFPLRRRKADGTPIPWTGAERGEAFRELGAIATRVVDEANRVFVQVAPGGGALTIPRTGGTSSTDGVVRTVPTIGEA